ncbi:glycosyltransferase [Citrobacter sp. Cpo030]|uniref:glycosyltransferase n=1 Tax=Citrobacter TaxID=544 RepID=UPI001EB78C18|nr:MULTISPECIES: glycosyltransferase [Citrobacter]EGT0019450.1 glycosyltransferase [Citrobacter freundii]EGT0456011.1 glycosyltransferase [Citrobacter freundii]MDM2895206.1 glycosyltransferase [Citrobacter sp. Cpo030]MDN4384138.1 glycosyltransferase [Citrobacter portucalensis]MDN4403376.1 glycosyltransferase [Citrobacter portucalensis]
MKKMVVAVIVTYNRKSLLEKSIAAILAQSVAIEKMIVVDNNSSDGTEDYVKLLRNDNINIEYYNTGANLGGAGGFHAGFKIAEKYDYSHLWIMDDDFIPQKDCLEVMLSYQHIGIIQPLRFNLDGTCAELSPVKYDLSTPYLINPKRTKVVDFYENDTMPDSLQISGVPFEGPLISREVINSIGYPNPDYFIFNDDLDYSLRARKYGYEIICLKYARGTRLLTNNQNNDLSSWKGYFMLRNLFHIHYAYGENIFVKYKPVILVLGYALKCIFAGNFSSLKTVANAYFDSFALKNNEKHKP